MDAYPDTFAFVQIHHGDAYATAWGNARANFYGLQYYPESWFDGTLHRVGAQSYATYQNDYLTRRGVPTDVTIDLGGVQVSGSTFNITAGVCIEAGGTGKTMRIYIVQVLDRWPTVVTYSRNGFKQAAATQDITLAQGECQNVLRTFTFDSVSWANQDDITIIAWAQQPYNSGPAEVFQAAIMKWPFQLDCNLNEIPDDCDLDCELPGCDVPGCGESEDCNENGIPDECELGGDENCNGNDQSDLCDIYTGYSDDCNENAVPDECDIDAGTSQDCQPNDIPDECELDNAEAADDCAAAQSICRVKTYYGTTVGATNDGSASCGSAECPDVWYYYKPYGGGYATISLCGSSFDTVLSLHDGCPGTPDNEVMCNDNYCGQQSQLTNVLVTHATDYWIRVSGKEASDVGEFELAIVAGPACTYPAGDENDNGIPDECERPCLDKADSNCDGAVNGFDIDPFVLALTQGQAAWEAAYTCDYLCANDCNDDEAVNGFDIDPFVALLTGK